MSLSSPDSSPDSCIGVIELVTTAYYPEFGMEEYKEIKKELEKNGFSTLYNATGGHWSHWFVDRERQALMPSTSTVVPDHFIAVCANLVSASFIHLRVNRTFYFTTEFKVDLLRRKVAEEFGWELAVPFDLYDPERYVNIDSDEKLVELFSSSSPVVYITVHRPDILDNGKIKGRGSEVNVTPRGFRILYQTLSKRPEYKSMLQLDTKLASILRVSSATVRRIRGSFGCSRSVLHSGPSVSKKSRVRESDVGESTAMAAAPTSSVAAPAGLDLAAHFAGPTGLVTAPDVPIGLDVALPSTGPGLMQFSYPYDGLLAPGSSTGVGAPSTWPGGVVYDEGVEDFLQGELTSQDKDLLNLLDFNFDEDDVNSGV